MKRIVRRVQSLNERAAELTAAVGQLPERVAELRGAVTATSGQLQNLKSDIQVNVADLMMDREDDLSAALAEVAGHAPLFADAGFILDGFDLEVSPVQQLVIELIRHQDVALEKIQSLIAGVEPHGTVAALLSAILKARGVAELIEVDGLIYDKLVVSIGPVPSIRLCWRTGSREVAEPSRSSFALTPAGGSFFDSVPHGHHAAVASVPYAGYEPEHAVETETVTHDGSDQQFTDGEVHGHDPSHEPVAMEFDEHTPTAVVAPPEEPVADSVLDPLARFKVMPTLTRK